MLRFRKSLENRWWVSVQSRYIHGDHFATTDRRRGLYSGSQHLVTGSAAKANELNVVWWKRTDEAHLFQRDLWSECTRGTSPGALPASCAACSCDCSGCTYRASLLQAGVSVIHQRTRWQHRTGTLFRSGVNIGGCAGKTREVYGKVPRVSLWKCTVGCYWKNYGGASRRHKGEEASYRAIRSEWFSSVRLIGTRMGAHVAT